MDIVEPTLHEQIESLRIQRAPTPAWIFLLIISRAERSCYINYMAGAKALHRYLTNNGETSLNLELHKYPDILNPEFKIPILLSSNYYVEQVAKIMATNPDDLTEIAKMHRAIYIIMKQKVATMAEKIIQATPNGYKTWYSQSRL